MHAMSDSSDWSLPSFQSTSPSSSLCWSIASDSVAMFTTDCRSSTIRRAAKCLDFSFSMAAVMSSLLYLVLVRWSWPHKKHPLTPRIHDELTLLPPSFRLYPEPLCMELLPSPRYAFSIELRASSPYVLSRVYRASWWSD